jgi:hypothetical protein
VGLPSAEVKHLLDTVNVTRWTEGGRGTLLTSPVIVASGAHYGAHGLTDQNGRQLGSSIPRPGEVAWGYDICDPDGRCLLVVEKVGLGRRERRTRWDVSKPGDARIITLRTLEGGYAIAEDSLQIGRLHKGEREGTCSIEDEHGHAFGRVQLARKKISRMGTERVDLVVEIEDQTPDPFREVTIAASVIADVSMIEFPSPSMGM